MEKNQIVINSKSYSNAKTIEIKSDVIVPDSKPDTVSIINSNGTVYINKETKSQGKCYLDGIIDVYIVYLSDIGDTRSLSTQIAFSEVIENNKIFENSCIKYKLIINELNVKILNERKISLDGTVSLKFNLYNTEEISILDESLLKSDCLIEKLKEDIEVKSLVGSNLGKATIKENILTKQDKKILEIVKVDVEILNKENKISYNKILTKADCKIKIIYLNEECKINEIEETFPLMSFIDIEKINDSNLAEVSYTLRNINLKINSQNETQFSVQIEYEVFAEVYEVKKIEIIKDMYSLNKSIKYSKRNVYVNVNSNNFVEKNIINEKISLDKNISNVYDMECRPRVLSIKNNIVEGEMNFVIYYEADEKVGLNVKNVTLPFIINNVSYDNIDDFSIEIINKNVTISGENVDISVEFSIDAKELSWKNISIIENIEYEEVPSENTYKMYMYFVKAGDTIWKIAKKFKVKMEDLILINNLETPDKINVGDKIYIMK